MKYYVCVFLVTAWMILKINSVKASCCGSCENCEDCRSSGKGGAIFTRWGRTTCPLNNELIYAGYSAGSDHAEQGGGSNYICLPRDPIFRPNGPDPARRALIHGAEYQYPPISGLHDYDAPCAVCQSQLTSLFMLPGRDECYPGWVTEYSGYLAAEHHTHHRSTFVCVDGNPEAAGVNSNEDGVLFYPVQTRCGSLPCSVYPSEKDLRCAICSR